MYPLGAAIRPVSFFPNWHGFLEPVNSEATGLEGLGSVRATDCHRDTHLPYIQVPEPVNHDHFADRPALPGRALDLSHLLLRHAWIGVIVQCDRYAASRQVP